MMLPVEEAKSTRSNQKEEPLDKSSRSIQRSSSHRENKIEAAFSIDGKASTRSGGHYSSSHRERSGRNDDYHSRSNRDRDRSHSDRDRDRDRNYGSSRVRDSYRDKDDRRERRDHRDRRSRSPEGGGESKHSSREHRRSPRNDRSHGGSSSRFTRERSEQDKLSAEIEQELANLRRKHDLKEALTKEQKKKGMKDSSNPTQGNSSTNKTVRVKPSIVAYSVLNKRKSDFIPLDDGLGAQATVEYVPEIQTEEERIEFQRKMQEKLQQHLAAEGKLYPPPAKPCREPPAPIAVSGFANDGSFLEMFKMFQQQQVITSDTAAPSALPIALPHAGALGSSGRGTEKPAISTASGVVGGIPKIQVNAQTSSTAAPFKIGAPVGVLAAKPATEVKPSTIDKEPPPPPLPVFGRRRGGKILKTGLVKKVRPIEESIAETPNDPWTLYLQEVKKYKSASCDADSKTRPLVK